MDPLAEAAALLPPWAPWLHPLATLLLTTAAAGLGGLILSALALAPLKRLPADAHWTERARLAWGARATAPLHLAITLPLGCVIGALLPPSDALRALPLPVLAALAALVALAITLPLRRRLLTRLGLPPLPVRRQLRGALALLLAFYPHLALPLLALPLALQSSVGAAAAAALSASLTLALLAGGGVWLAARFGALRPAPEALTAALARAAQGSTAPPPRSAWTVELAAANAWAFPNARALVVTQRALDALDPDALRAVCAHELGHLTEPRRSSALRTLTCLSWSALLLLPATLPHPLPSALLLLASLGLHIATRRVARRMERRADHAALDDPAALARALETLHRLNLVPAVMPGSAHVHPHLYDRLRDAGLQPDWPRPEPPPAGPRRALTLVALLVPAALFVASDQRLSPADPLDPDDGLTLALAARDGLSADELRRLGERQQTTEHLIIFYQAALHLDPEDATTRAPLALALALRDRCGEAEAVASGLLHAEARVRAALRACRARTP